jgi:hypothetical protein
MKKLAGIVAMLVLVGVASTAFAETVTVKYQGVQTTGTVHLTWNGGYWGYFYAAPMNILVNSDKNTAFCIDLAHTISAGVQYLAELVTAPREDKYCKMAWVIRNYPVTDNFTGSVLQVAVWKLFYGMNAVKVSEVPVENEANILALEAVGKCPLACGAGVQLFVDIAANMYGELKVTALLTENGLPVVGEKVYLGTDSGAFVDLPGGFGVTNNFGKVYGTIDLGGGALPMTVTASAYGEWLKILIPKVAVQTLQTLTFGEPCAYEGTGTFDATPMGDPLTIGFWKHQANVAMGAKGKAQVPATELAAMLPLTVFGTKVATLADLYTLLWLKNATMAQRAVQQCLATMLNKAYGQLDWYTDLDLDADGVADGWFYEFYLSANDAFAAGDYETAKTICDTINNL